MLCLYLRQMQNIDKQYPAQSVVGDDRHKVVYRRDKRARGYRRVDLDLLEKERDKRAYRARYHHSYEQREADTARHRERKAEIVLFDEHNVQPYEHDRDRAEDESVKESDARFFYNEPEFLRKAQVFVGQDPDRHRKRLGSDVTRHIEYKRLERHNERQLRHDLFKRADDR